MFSGVSVYAGATAQPDAINDTITVKFSFAFFRSEPKISFTNIKGVFFNGKNVKVLGYSGNYVFVEDVKTQAVGYIHKMLLDDKPLNIKQNYINIYSGDYKEGSITVNYEKDGDLEWSVSSEGIVEISKHNKNSLSVKGIRPGTVTLTVRCGNDEDNCKIYCINKWTDVETAVAQSDISVVSTPEKTDTVWIIYKGATITARGNIPDKQNYLYVSSGNNWGYIKITDFSSIEYLMNMYHCYDQGYDLRFGSASTKIYSYSSVLNDVMMDNFKLKVCPFVESYTSVADQCKILQFGSVKSNNLSSSCPKNGKHNSESCLTTKYLRDRLISDKGNGSNTLTKTVWTGHIMDGHKPSNSGFFSQTLVFTTANTVSYNSGTYSNKSSYYINHYSLYELTHETGHQLGLHDGYCYEDGNGKHCSNENCFYCNGEQIPNCIMAKIISPINSTNMFCENCKESINSHLENHH